VIANFSSDSEIGNKGRIFVIPIEKIIEHCYDLTQCPGERPKRQKAFALWDFKRGIDLKNNQFLMEYSAEWFDFTVDEKDKIFSKPDYYYPLKNDSVAKCIIDWYDNSEIKSKLNDLKVKDYLNEIITSLKNYGG